MEHAEVGEGNKLEALEIVSTIVDDIVSNAVIGSLLLFESLK